MRHEVKCIILDDEPKAIHILQQRLSLLFPDINIVGTYTEWAKGLEAMRTTEVDLVFLDISMPEKSGMDLLKLFPSLSFQVIFVTAHTEFALDAIKLSATGYVLKPIDDFELSFAVNKALEKINKGPKDNGNGKVDNALKIGIPNAKGIDYLNSNEILYFEGVNKYTKVVTTKYSIVSSYNLAEFKKITENINFFQVHRSYIVNLLHIKRYEASGTIVMEDNMQIPVAKTLRTEFMTIFSKMSRTAGFKDKE